MQAADVSASHILPPPELAADLAEFFFLTQPEPPFFYLSDRIIFFRRAGTSWHYHPWDETLMCQVKGPVTVGLLDVRNPLHPHIRHVFFKEDYYDQPFAFNALPAEGLPWFQANLETGDALYIPPLWWHGIVATREEAGVTAPVSWKSPSHVIAETIHKMATVEIDIIGVIPAGHIQSLVDFSWGAGVGQATAGRTAQRRDLLNSQGGEDRYRSLA